ncbi:RICIN domain-containing protein [Virgisporangium aliadipatigenens]|uniref:RICIN domain-containing protein n=1 Tax=Virgisporangium aliadipatigenens TaxID=741659 RepID=UPI0019414331|nr:RICIN domain-containing protein [Virgisporangium aliadipatigenens]
MTGSPPPHEPRPAVYRSGGEEHTSPGLYGARRRRPDPLLLIGVGVLVLGLFVGGVLALQALSGPAPKTALDDVSPSSAAAPSSAPSAPASSAARPSSAAPSRSSAAPVDPNAPQQLGAIKGSASGLCVDLAPGQPGPGGAAAIAACGGAPAQRWFLTPAGALVNVANGQCLGVAGGAGHDGAPIVLEPCAQSPAQQWRFAASPDGRIAFQVVHSGKCLDVVNEGTAPGTPLQQFTCNGRTNQSWLTG